MDQDQRRAGRVGPYSWERDDERRGCYIVRHDRFARTVTCGMSWESVEEFCKDHWREEKEAEAALLSADPLALCRIGWHQNRTGDDPYFFRWMGSGKLGVRLNFWISSVPLKWAGTRIAGIGPQAVPWHCVVCNQDVPDEGEVQ